MPVGRILRWALLTVAILALILIPFFLWGSAIESWFARFRESAGQQPLLLATVLAGLLAVDVLLPIPSSLVSTSAGFLLGFAAGTLASLAGMTVSCLAAYALGLLGGRPLCLRLIGASELAQLEHFNRRFGIWMIIVTRPVPVLADASTLCAGMGRMPFGRYLAMTSLSNFGISAAYSAVGAFATARHSFLLAFAGAMLLPLLAMSLAWMTQRHPSKRPPPRSTTP